MILKKLTLHNFGVYANTNTFEFEGNKPVVLIGGLNGRGKTTFLEAILLSLYGSNSFAYNESKYKSYGQYLKSYVNSSDGTMQTYVELEFILENDDETYLIHREWDAKKQRTTEVIYVYRNGEKNIFLTENWSMFIENILPSGLSNFFFFDGEKIAELAVEETSAQMKESIKILLGINVLDTLESDIKRIVSKLAKNHIDKKEEEQIDELKLIKENAITKLRDKDEELVELNVQLDQLKKKLEKLKLLYSSKGGDVVAQRQELFNERTSISTQIEHLKDLLVSDAASELPLLLVRDLLVDIRENAEFEQDTNMLEIAIKKMNKSFEKYKEIEKNTDGVEKFLEYFKEQTNRKHIDVKYNLSDMSLFKIQVLLDDQLLRTRLETDGHQKEIRRINDRLDKIDSYLNVDIDEKAIAEVFKKIKNTENKIIEIESKIHLEENIRRNLNGDVIKATSEFNKKVEKYLKKVELNDDGERILKYSHMANMITDEYKIRLQKSKIDTVAETMTKCYKKLANKKNLINRIDMDPVNLDLIYLDKKNNPVDKSSLSAGEKQLMVISLLWALAICSKRKLPVIIDTPLSRLDSVHRLSLIKTYFPNASEQTIILSTDSEIDKNYYDIMKDDIGDEFTLIYDDETKSTSIRNGYVFAEDVK